MLSGNKTPYMFQLLHYVYVTSCNTSKDDCFTKSRAKSEVNLNKFYFQSRQNIIRIRAGGRYLICSLPVHFYDIKSFTEYRKPLSGPSQLFMVAVSL